jgi:hypothetical protein
LLKLINFGLKQVLEVVLDAMQYSSSENFNSVALDKVHKAGFLLITLLKFVPQLAPMMNINPEAIPKLSTLSADIVTMVNQYMSSNDNTRTACLTLFNSIGSKLKTANIDELPEYKIYFDRVGSMLMGQSNY